MKEQYKYIALLPSLGTHTKDFTDFMRRVSRNLSRCSLNGRRVVVEKFRTEVLNCSNRPQATHELEFAFTISAILDLLAIGWNIRVRAKVVQIAPPALENLDLAGKKEFIRQGHLIDRDSQLSERSVVEFIRKMERRHLTSTGWYSIFSVMRDGGALSRDLAQVRQLPDSNERLQKLRHKICPYLEFVNEEEKCVHTGLYLHDVWRYFRHTWVNAYNSLPGRSMMILVRDAAATNHPVIGIAALGSAVAQQEVRDRWIGWDSEIFIQQVKEKPELYGRWMLESLAGLIKSLYIDDLLAEERCHLIDIDYPTEHVIARLFKEADKAIKEHRLYPRAAYHKAHQGNSAKQVDWEAQARSSLFRSKRCKTLGKLLRIRRLFRESGLHSGSKEELEKALGHSMFRDALRQLIRMVKAEHVGVDMMDIVVCGAVAPYNILLGGKLISMLLCSSEVVKSYARRYGEQVSVIASSMKGAPVIRAPRLVLLSTTSLYSVGSSQYNRVRIPCDRIGGTSGEQLEYKELGSSKGYGTYHVSSITTEIAEALVGRKNSGRQVNSIFGEGANPRLRKLREAFDRVGLPSDEILCHGNSRVVYGISLARNFSETLLGLEKHPSFYVPLTEVKDCTDQIAEYWRERWLLRRIERPEILEEVAKHTLSYPIQHGARVRLPDAGEDLSSSDV
jgi:hypothetical protein